MVGPKNSPGLANVTQEALIGDPASSLLSQLMPQPLEELPSLAGAAVHRIQGGKYQPCQHYGDIRGRMSVLKLERKHPRPVRNAVEGGLGQPKAQGKRLWLHPLKAGADTNPADRKEDPNSSS